MRFGIRDLLILTVVAAVVAVALQSLSQIRHRTVAIARANAKLKASQSQLSLEQATLGDSQHRLDYYDQVGQMHQAAVAGFDDLIEKYGKVEQQRGKIGLRRHLVLKEVNEQSVWGFRIAVPEEYPVFLRSGIVLADTIESADRHKLDAQSWLENVCLEDSRKRSIQLQPGIHTLIFKSNRSSNETQFSTLEIVVDGAELLKTKTRKAARRPSSSSSTNPKEQYNFDFQFRETMRLVHVEYEEEGVSPNYEFWIWLSSKESSEGFTPFEATSVTEGNNE